jgi:His/Glu/Gln/Arg/opine family amino acid ABC transporter permease subunit
MQVWRWDGFFDYLFNRYLLEGALITVALTVGALFCGLILGIGIALLRLSGNRLLAGIAAVYCWLFRGTPLLVQLLVFKIRSAVINDFRFCAENCQSRVELVFPSFPGFDQNLCVNSFRGFFELSRHFARSFWCALRNPKNPHMIQGIFLSNWAPVIHDFAILWTRVRVEPKSDTYRFGITFV